MSNKKKGFWMTGMHPVKEILLNNPENVFEIQVTDKSKEQLISHSPQMAKNLKSCRVSVFNKKAFDQRFPDQVHQGIAALVREKELTTIEHYLDTVSDKQSDDTLVILDQVTDPHNLGAIIRSACFFGIKGIVIQKTNSANISAVVAKAASGGLEHVSLISVTNIAQTMDLLKKEQYWCVGLDERGEKSLFQDKFTAKTALVFGAEGKGLRKLTLEKCDYLLNIPRLGPLNSLNVSAAAAVSFYEIAKQKSLLQS